MDTEANKRLEYQKIYAGDYAILTSIMTAAFNEDTSLHTELKADGPTGYNDGSLIRKLNEKENFKSYKIIYQGSIVGAYTVGINGNNEYTLEMFFIDPACRGGHLGTAVWQDIEGRYRDARKWIVETPSYSTRNHYFYTKKCGFIFCRENIRGNDCKSFVFEK